ncbi:MAG: putative two-component system sensor kinase [Planctomycetaceae bacterium]|nr:putative two-component system sensor kinase [Planctomycetaceae bacterium]
MRPLTQAWLRIWQVQNGLPRASIFAIRQSSDGYIWLGTQNGLYRFDGVRFATIDDTKGFSLKNVWIDDLVEDQEQNLWLATDNSGLVQLRDGTTTQFGVSDGMPSEHVRCLLVSQSGKLWIGTDKGLACLDQGTFQVFQVEQGLGSNDVQALCETSDGTIWIGGGNDQLSAWDGKKFKLTTLSSLPERGSVRALLGTTDGVLWAGTSAGLVQLKNGQQRRFTRAEGLADDWVHSIAKAGQTGIWVGTKDGISRLLLDGGEIESFRSRNGLSQSTVYSLCEDHEGSLWAGTKNGLNQFGDRRTIPFTTNEGLPSNDTGPLLQDQSGRVWVGTLGAGLARYDGRSFSVAATKKEGLPSDTVLALANGVDNELWIGTDHGICRMQGGKVQETLTTEHGLPSNIVRSLCRDHTGTIWAGTTLGLAELRHGRFVQPSGDPAVLRLPVLAMMDFQGKALLVSTQGGGMYSVTDRQMRLLADRGQVTPGIDALYEDRDGLLWMGCRGRGLGLFDGNKTTYFTVKDGLHDDDITGIVADDNDRIWMACSRGIFFVLRTELRKFAAGEVTTLKSSPFSPTKELRTVECRSGVQPSLWKMQDGSVWFSTISGLIVVDQKHFIRDLPAPSVLVEEVRVNGQNMSPHELKSLPPRRTNLDFRYTALSLTIPTRITFQYMLEGFDKDWVDAGLRREAFYTNLSPGLYRFRVRALNPDDASWTEAAKPVSFRLEPHFFQTLWFIPACVAALGMTGFLLFRLRVRQIKSRLQAVLAERSRIARELHDTLIQGFSGVTMQMQALAARLHVTAERETLQEVIQDAGNCLREARRSVAGLRSPTSDESELAAAVAQVARGLTDGSDLRLKLKLVKSPRGLSADVEYNIVRIVQEAISNAVKHSGGGNVDVLMNYSPLQLSFSVTDDGVGFDVTNREFAQHGHYGLIGMRERATQIGAELKLESAAGRGTTVRLILPITTRISTGQAASAALSEPKMLSYVEPPVESTP